MRAFAGIGQIHQHQIRLLCRNPGRRALHDAAKPRWFRDRQRIRKASAPDNQRRFTFHNTAPQPVRSILRQHHRCRHNGDPNVAPRQAARQGFLEGAGKGPFHAA